MNIEELLVKSILGLLSPDEEKALKTWIGADPSHEAYFKKLRSRHNYSELYHAYRARQAKAAPTSPRPWRRFMARAAMWMVPVLLAAGLWVGLHDRNHAPEEIVPGHAQATLFLENGTSINLTESKESGWIHIDDHLMATDGQGTLSYQNNHPALSKQTNRLATPRGGEYRIVLPDGTRVHLNSLSELQYPLAFDKEQRVVKLSGEAYFEIAKDPRRPFYVETNGITIRQYGTRFNVNARSLHATTIALEEGSVGVITPEGTTQMMKPGELATWDGETNTLQLAQANLEPHTGWHRGRFIFDDEPLSKIMEALSLWYDIDVRFQDTRIAAQRFTGNVGRYEDIHTILKGIETIVNVECQIKGKQVRIMKKQ